MLEIRVFSGDYVQRHYADEIEMENGTIHLYRVDTITNAFIETNIKPKKNERIAVREV